MGNWHLWFFLFVCFLLKNLNIDITFEESFYFFYQVWLCSKGLAVFAIRNFFAFFTLPTLFLCALSYATVTFPTVSLIFLHFHIKLFVLLINTWHCIFNLKVGYFDFTAPFPK